MLLLEISLNRKLKIKGVSPSPVMDGETEAQRDQTPAQDFAAVEGLVLLTALGIPHQVFYLQWDPKRKR